MLKSLESQLVSEDPLTNLCGFKSIAESFSENYEISTLGELLEIDLDNLEEEDLKALTKSPFNL